MLIIKSIERIENLSSSVFQPKIGMRSWWFKSFSVRLGKNNCSNPSHLPAHQAGSVERREAYVRLHLSITAYSYSVRLTPCLISKPFYRDDISYMYPKLTPVHPKRILLADLERINFDKKDIFNQRKQYLWIRSIHAFQCECEILLCRVGEYFVCGVGTWGILSLSDYSSALFFSTLERNKCLLKQIQTVKMKKPEESSINWTNKIQRPREQDSTFFLRPRFLILGTLKDLRPGVLKSMKNSSERKI